LAYIQFSKLSVAPACTYTASRTKRTADMIISRMCLPYWPDGFWAFVTSAFLFMADCRAADCYIT